MLGLDFIDDLSLVGSGEDVVVEGGKVAGPGVKDLNHLCPGIDLEAGVFSCFGGGREGEREGLVSWCVVGPGVKDLDHLRPGVDSEAGVFSCF